MKKRLLLVLLTLTFVTLAFAGCSDKEEDKESKVKSHAEDDKEDDKEDVNMFPKECVYYDGNGIARDFIELEYDEQGKIIKKICYSTTNTGEKKNEYDKMWEYTYDGDTLVLAKETGTTSGGYTAQHEFSYDDKGKLKYIYTKSNMVLVSLECEYDEQGRLTKENIVAPYLEMFLGDTLLTYSEILGGHIENSRIYEYDEAGKLQYMTGIGTEAVLSHEYIYGEDGKLTKENVYYGTDKGTGYTIEYRNDGKKSKEYTFGDTTNGGETYTSAVYEYDENDRLTKVEKYDASGKVHYYKEIKY